jgi:hypothetical protein
LRNLIKHFSAILVVLNASNAFADGAASPLPSIQCGATRIVVSPARTKGGDVVLQNFRVELYATGRHKVFEYSAENDFLSVGCEPRGQLEPYLVLNHHCGGSGCAEGNYSIIDLSSLTEILKANERWRGNANEAAIVLQKPPARTSCSLVQGESACFHAEQE